MSLNVLKIRERVLLAPGQEVEGDLSDWYTIRDGGWPKRHFIYVAGDSGYSRPRWFVCIAQYDTDRGNGLAPDFKARYDDRELAIIVDEIRWRDVQGEPIKDAGWVPLLWRPAPRFFLETDPRNMML